MSVLRRLFGSASLVLAAFACGAENGPASPAGTTYSFVTGPEMLPGDNCRSCHGAPSSPYPEAPDWSFAGTVFEGPDSDTGVSGVTVTVSDATGAEVQAMTNAAGNFYAAAPIVAPYTVSLKKGENSIVMAVPPPAGGCNACHAKRPVGGAPGRLFLPDSGFTSAAQCDGEHTVTVGDTRYDCAPYLCDAASGACLHACTDDTDCVDEAPCEDGRCSAP